MQQLLHRSLKRLAGAALLLCIAVWPALASIAFVNVGTATSTSLANNAALTISVPSGGIPAGSVIVLFATAHSYGIYPSGSGSIGFKVSDSASNTYLPNSGLTTSLNNGGVYILSVVYTYNAAVANGGTISILNSSGTAEAIAVTAMYVTGAATATDPIDPGGALQWSDNFGSSTSPSVTYTGSVTANMGFVAAVGWYNSSTFTQDNTHAAYATPPNYAAASSTTEQVEGGSVVASTALTYAPTLGTSRLWAAQIIGINPPSAPAGGVPIFGLFGANDNDVLKRAVGE